VSALAGGSPGPTHEVDGPILESKGPFLAPEVTVDPGGGAGWDESPLDIQIPDDARELDRDVLAYHRELRAQRRRGRLRALGGPLAGNGTIMPLLASILAVCLVAGAMLSVATFSPATAPNRTHPAASTSPPVTPRASATASAPPATARPSATARLSATASPSATGRGTGQTAGTGRATHPATPSASAPRPVPSGLASGSRAP